MSENLTSQFGLGWGGGCGCCEDNSSFGYSCNGSFFETLIMLIIIIWLLRWLFSCGIFGGNCGCNCGCNNNAC